MNAETIKDTLRRWSVAFVDTGMPFNHEATTHNEQEFTATHALILKAQGWLKAKSFPARSTGELGKWVQISCLQYKFKLTYAPKKHINQSETAIQTYHTSNFSGQELALARFILNSPVPVSTRSALDYFRENKHEGGPVELNSASRAMNSLKREGVTIDGTRYWLQLAETKPNEGTGKPADFFRLVKAEETKISTPQQTLFEI